jgi:hypothetical protein
MTTRIRRHTAALAVAAALVLLTGCRADLTTEIDAAQPQDASVTLTASGAVADALLRDPALDQRLLATVADASGNPTKRDESDGTITYRTTVDGTEPPAGLLGFSSVISPSGDGSDALVTLERPSALIDAIAAATKSEPDGDAQRIAWGNALIITVTVCGRGEAVTTSGVENVVLTDGCATLEESLNAWPSRGEWTVGFERKFPVRAAAVVLGLLLTAAFAATLRPRRR